MWIAREIGPSPYAVVDTLNDFFAEVHERIRLRLGVFTITKKDFNLPVQTVGQYLLDCPGEEFLDFIEDIFHLRSFHGLGKDPNKWVEEINILFRVENLPYFVTDFVTERTEHKSLYRTSVVALPKVVLKESEILHSNAIAPALQLLQNPLFANANKEFLDGLEDYRKGDYDDCLVKVGSAFESVMKIICDKKKWEYKQTHAAGPLVKAMIDNMKLESFFDPLLMVIATLRNKMSTAHGAGTKAKSVPRHMAKYSINVTASTIIMLVEEAKL